MTKIKIMIPIDQLQYVLDGLLGEGEEVLKDNDFESDEERTEYVNYQRHRKEAFEDLIDMVKYYNKESSND